MADLANAERLLADAIALLARAQQELAAIGDQTATGAVSGDPTTFDPKVMNLTSKVALEVASHEAIIRQAYKDSVGVWTWSVGLTSQSGHHVERYIDNPQPLEKCLAIYIWALENYAKRVRTAFSGRRLTEGQFAAALSFHWNTGAIAKATWVKQFKAGDTNAARKSIMNYRKPAEIIPRRTKERDLFFDGQWSGDGKMVEYTELTTRKTPLWKSAKRIDVHDQIEGLIKGQVS